MIGGYLSITEEMNKKIESIIDIKGLISENNYKIFGIGGTPITRAAVYSFIEEFELICTLSSGEFASVKEKFKANCFEMKNRAGFDLLCVVGYEKIKQKNFDSFVSILDKK